MEGLGQASATDVLECMVASRKIISSCCVVVMCCLVAMVSGEDENVDM